MPRSIQHPRATVRPLIEGLGALVVLVCGLVGIPLVLATTVGWPLPHHLSGGGQVADASAQHHPRLVLAPSLRVLGLDSLGLLRLFRPRHSDLPCPHSVGASSSPSRAPQCDRRPGLCGHHGGRRPQPVARCSDGAHPRPDVGRHGSFPQRRRVSTQHLERREARAGTRVGQHAIARCADRQGDAHRRSRGHLVGHCRGLLRQRRAVGGHLSGQRGRAPARWPSPQ